MKNLKVVVKKAFTDRYTGLKHKAGETLTVSEKRYREIKRSGEYVEIASNGKPEAETKNFNLKK